MQIRTKQISDLLTTCIPITGGTLNANLNNKSLTNISSLGVNTSVEVGGSSEFQVNLTGNIIKINNIATSFPSIQGGASTVLQNDGSGNLNWAALSTGVSSLAAIGLVPNANGATLTGTILNLEPASASFGGVVTTGTQTFAGNKTFNNHIGIGATATNGFPIYTALAINTNGGVAILAENELQSSVTSNGSYFRSTASTQAAAFTLSNLYHFRTVQGTFGAGSVVTTQIGFEAGSTLIGGTNNYGFRGAIASGTNRYNVYMDGTAQNYFAGNVGIGTATPTTKLDISNTTAATDAVNISDVSTSNTTTRESVFMNCDMTPTADINTTTLAANIVNRGTQNLTSSTQGMLGMQVAVQNRATGGTVTNATAYSAIFSQIGSGGTTTNATGFRFRTASLTAGTPVNVYGFRVDAQTIGTTLNVGYQSAIASGTGRYNLYMDGTAQNYFAGNVGIGTVIPTAVLHLKGGSASSSSAPLKFSSGALNITPEVGAIEFLTDAYYATITTGAARKTFAFLESNAVNNKGINVTFDGQGIIIPLNTNSIIAAAATNGTITAWFIEGDVSGSIVIDILKNGVSMSGAGNKPTLASALTANAAVSGWTSVTFATNDKLEIKVTTASTTLTKCYLTIKYNIS